MGFQKLQVKEPFSPIRESRAWHQHLTTSANKAVDKQDLFGGRGEHPHAILWRIQYISFGLLNYMFIFLQGKKEHLSPCPCTEFPLWVLSFNRCPSQGRENRKLEAKTAREAQPNFPFQTQEELSGGLEALSPALLDLTCLPCSFCSVLGFSNNKLTPPSPFNIASY